jgi:hypothetical protein
MDKTVLGEKRSGREKARQGKEDTFHGGQHLRKYRQFPGKTLYL